MNEVIEKDKEKFEEVFKMLLEISKIYDISNNDVHELEEIKRHVIKKMNKKMKDNLKDAIKKID